jgi:hypothetical protein
MRVRQREVTRGTTCLGWHRPRPPFATVITSCVAWSSIALLGLLPPSELGAQQREVSGELVGRVVDAASGEPVAAALVALEAAPGGASLGLAGGTPRALTASDGRFELSAVPVGMSVLRVEHLAYGVHRHPLRIEGDGSGFVEVAVSVTAIALEPLLVEADRSTELGGRGSPSARNVIGREAISEGAASGVSVGDFLSREVAGMYVRRNAQLGGPVCLEFRGARRGDGPCRPPQVYIDGITVPNPLDFFGHFSLDGLERIRVISPSEAGARFGPNSGWGVLLLETRRTGLDSAADIVVVQRARRRSELVDWGFEGRAYPWARVYAAAFVGNAAGLAGGAVVMSRCMDLGTRRFYRGSDACGVGLLLTSGVAMAVLPALGGSFGGRLAGTTPQSRGNLGRSILYSLPVYVPGFAIASINAGGGGLGGADLLGLAMVVLGAPVLNTAADHMFREPR